MWIIVKFDKKNLEFLKNDFKKKLGEDFTIYNPKLSIQKYKNNKLINKEFNLLGDYLFCFHKNFNKSEILNQLKFTRGLKYFLSGFKESQNEIKQFIQKCKNCENDKGYLSQNFFDLYINAKYKFTSGPFSEMIFKIIDLQKNKINILLGDIKTTIKKNEFIFSPI